MPEIPQTSLVETDSEFQPIPFPSHLKRKQIKAAMLLGQSMAQKEVARIVKVSEWTIGNWLKLPDFQDAVMEANRLDIHEIRATRNRVIRKAQEVVEAELDNVDSPKRVEIAREVVRSVL